MTHRGALLLETMLALAIFIMAGAAILSLIDGSITSLGRAKLHEQAADLARSAMARIEAGIETPRTLHGPARSWLEEAAERGDFPEPAAAVGRASDGWELEIDTDRSPFDGLTHVTVTARKVRGDETVASYTLRQLVRLSGRVEDRAGELDALLGADRPGGARGGRP